MNKLFWPTFFLLNILFKILYNFLLYLKKKKKKHRMTFVVCERERGRVLVLETSLIKFIVMPFLSMLAYTNSTRSGIYSLCRGISLESLYLDCVHFTPSVFLVRILELCSCLFFKIRGQWFISLIYFHLAITRIALSCAIFNAMIQLGHFLKKARICSHAWGFRVFQIIREVEVLVPIFYISHYCLRELIRLLRAFIPLVPVFFATVKREVKLSY